MSIASEVFKKPSSEKTIAKASRAVIALGLLSFASVTLAQPPYQPDMVTGGNKWAFRAYDDASPAHTKLVDAQGICFEYAGVSGNHQLYTWYSDTFPGWRGTAVQEGDQVFLHGDYANGAGHSSIQIETLVMPPIYGSAGYWQEWRDDGAQGLTVGFANTRSLREGNCSITAAQAAALPPLLTGDPLRTDVTP